MGRPERPPRSPRRSPLEYALLKPGSERAVSFRQAFLRRLDDSSLRSLRAVSPILRDMVDSQSGRMYRELFLLAPFAEDLPNREFERVANFCHDLTIKISQPASPSSSLPIADPLDQRIYSRPLWAGRHDTLMPTAHTSLPFGQLTRAAQSTQTLADKKWASIFAQCPDLRRLTVRVYGDPDWPGRTIVEDTLVTIRRALEHCSNNHLTEIRFHPIHAMGIIHLGWTGLGAFGRPTPLLSQQPRTQPIWPRLHTLDLQLADPFTANALTQVQLLMLRKLLYSYLRSFTLTLRILRWHWQQTLGPSPLTLHLEEGLAGQREPLVWEALEELWVGNITFPHRTIRVAGACAPRLGRLMVLRSTYRDDLVDHTTDGAWVDHFPSVARQGGGLLDHDAVMADNASSLYSRGVSDDGEDVGGDGWSSQDPSLMLENERIAEEWMRGQW
ncbi:hypothetical protein LTR53_015088 [Teratosphaeriaceae sp. CCFEE 6253]|nr:hypothetical protein LTR53_015088 [Teratosphaeriaceae sp. CCFEE 6253]